MEFDKILEDGRLWAVKYEGDKDNCFDALFSKWYDMKWLKGFFKENLSDLSAYFRITDVYQAVAETIEDASKLECLILDIAPEANLDTLFKHLENYRISEMTLGREKAKGKGINGHHSWLRIYALRIDPGIYLITGGAIKLTANMEERSHTFAELARLESVRNYLIENSVYDNDGLTDFIDNE